MKDLIERQKAIDALKDWYDGMIISSFRGVEKVIKALPSAQPEIEERKEESAQNVPKEDLISRKVAIDAMSESLKRVFPEHRQIAEKCLKALPSARPEPQWIPVSERLPGENVPVLLGVRFKDDFKFFVSARIDYNYWSGLGREIKGELRWLPLPEPYRVERRTDDANDIT